MLISSGSMICRQEYSVPEVRKLFSILPFIFLFFFFFSAKACCRHIIENSWCNISLLYRRVALGKYLVRSRGKEERKNDREMEWRGRQGRYGNDEEDDKKLIILFLYLALYILLAYSHAYSGDILCVDLYPTDICRLHASLSLHVCVRLLNTSIVVIATLDHLEAYEGVFSGVDV